MNDETVLGERIEEMKEFNYLMTEIEVRKKRESCERKKCHRFSCKGYEGRNVSGSKEKL